MELFITMRKRNAFPGAMEMLPEDMPMDVVLRALDVAAASKAPQILMRGNESLLHPELELILKGCRKRGIMPVFETSGLMPTMAKRLLKEYNCGIGWRLYRPNFYTDEDLREMQGNLKELVDGTLPSRLLLMVDDLDADYSFVQEYFDNFQFGALQIRLPCLKSQNLFGKFMEQYIEWLKKYLALKKNVILDCGIMPCAFTDAQYGFVSKANGQIGHCIPHLGVLPDGHVCHCKEMAMLPGPHISTFRNEAELRKYYYDVFLSLQWQVNQCPGCQGCICVPSGTCTGVSMASKAHLLLGEFEQLKKRLEEEKGELSEEERAQLLWNMTNVCMILALYPDAIECLEELRRQHPEDARPHYFLGVAYWETGRLSDGEDEFRKCSRLSEDPIPALQELHTRLVQNGNTIRARLLQGEIDKEAAKMREKQEAENQK